MDEELHRYVLRSPRLLDNPPGVHPDTPLGDVSWRNDDMELSLFSSNSGGSAACELPWSERRTINWQTQTPNTIFSHLLSCNAM